MIFKEILLRAPEPDDVELLYRWENNPDIWQVSNTIAPYSKSSIRRHIEESSKSIFETGQTRFIICLSDTIIPIGTVDLFDFDPFHHRVGIGILIAESAYRRKGYAKMAIEAVVEYCFTHLKTHQIYCNILSNNIPSITLFENIGFQLTGTKKDWILDKDGYKDQLFYQLFSKKSK